MQIRYQLSPQDLPAFLATEPAWKRLLVVYIVPLLMALVSLPGTLWLVWLNHWTVLGICVGTMGLLAVWMTRKVRVMDHDPRLFLPQVMTITPECLENDSELGWGRRHWSAVEKVRDTAGHLFIFLERKTAFCVPKRAFASPAEAADFSAEAQGFHQRANEIPAPAAWGFPPERDPWVNADPARVMSVWYENEAEDLQVASQQKKPREGKLQRIFLMLVLIGLALFAGDWVADPPRDPFMRYVVPIAFFMVSVTACSLPLLFGWELFTAWQFHREPHWPQTVTISPAGIAVAGHLACRCHPWPVFQRIEENDRYLLVFLPKPGPASFVIPKKAFKGLPEVCRFLELARQFHEHAMGKKAGIAEAVKAVETWNPYQSPRE